MTRVGFALRASLVEYRRTPVLVALLGFLPAYLVGVFAVVAPDTPAAVRTAAGTVRVPLSAAVPAFTAPMATALVAGVAGLFVLRSSAGADGRLVLAGYRPWQVVVARLGVLAVVAALATAVAVAVALWEFDPRSLPAFAAGTFAAALAYGTVGAVAGLFLGRLGGVYLVLFGALVDLFLFQNPLATDAPDVARFLPGHYPMAVATDAAFSGDVQSADLVGTGVVLAALGLVGVLAFDRAMHR